MIKNIDQAHVDLKMVQMISRAHRWKQEYLCGDIPSLKKLASREKIDKGALSRMMELCFLSPDIIEAILAGKQPADLTAQKLLKQKLPLDWTEQRRVLGFV